jgi:hypothetical protein
MFDKELVLTILKQIDNAISKITYRTKNIKSAENFTSSKVAIQQAVREHASKMPARRPRPYLDKYKQAPNVPWALTVKVGAGFPRPLQSFRCKRQILYSRAGSYMVTPQSIAWKNWLK